MEEITKKVVNALYEEFDLFDNFYSNQLKNDTRNLETLGILFLKKWRKFKKILNFWKIFQII